MSDEKPSKINEKLLKPYNPKETEGRIYKLWEESGYFAPEAHQPGADNPNKDKTFTIALPPPNVTGTLDTRHRPRRHRHSKCGRKRFEEARNFPPRSGQRKILGKSLIFVWIISPR